MKKAFLYIRNCPQPPAEKSGGKCSQEKKLRQYCRLQHLKIAGVFSDIASAANFERPAFKAMLGCMEKNRGKSSLLLFHTWDRFSRSPAQAIEMLECLKGLKVKVKALHESESIFKRKRLPSKKAI